MSDKAPAWRNERERGHPAFLPVLKWLSSHGPDWLNTSVIAAISAYFSMRPSRVSAAGTAAYFQTAFNRRASLKDRYRQVNTFSHVIFERVGLLGENVDRFDISAHGEIVVEDALGNGTGGVLLGAHFGSFEAMRAFDRALPGLRIRYLMYEEHAEQTAAILNALNPEVAAQVIHVGDGHSAMMAVRETLAEGDFVAFLGDRMPSQNPRGQVEVRFFNQQIVVPRAPYLSAILAGVPLILCFCPRTGNRAYNVCFEQIYDGAPVPRSARDNFCAELAQRYANALESMCRQYPYNWFNFFDIWE